MLSLGLDENWTQERIKEFIYQIAIKGNDWIDFNEGTLIYNKYLLISIIKDFFKSLVLYYLSMTMTDI